LNGDKFTTCCLQRAIHYLPYDKALNLLKNLRKIVTGRLYISVTGIDSAIGDNYQDKEKIVQERFCRLSSDAAGTFNIHEPLCLYVKIEFEELMNNSGWEVEESWVSAFGNIKVICT
ncbi:MAG: hypothetical protein LR008_01155, partial [Candidatus Pacebacteria bacterium]|nr:hypothetical protein [Candidatus Paceibacterota bacterium]